MASSFRPSLSELAHRYPAVHFSTRVLEGVRAEVLEAFHAVPRRGAETGGILLGRIAVNGILVQDFEPVLCEHRFGPSWVLSDDDLRGLRETLEWFRNPGSGELRVLGFYRSQTRPEWDGGAADSALMQRFSCERGQLFLLLRPNRDESVSAELFLYEHGELGPAAEPVPFPASRGPLTIAPPSGTTETGAAPADAAAPVAAPSEAPAAAPLPEPTEPAAIEAHPVLPPPGPDPAPAHAAASAEAFPWDAGTEAELPPLAERRRILTLPPSTRPGRGPLETALPPSRRPWWIAALGAATVAALVFGYFSVVRRPNGPAPAPTSAAKAVAAPPASPAPFAPPPSAAPVLPETAASPAAASPAPPADVKQQIHDALARWAAALRSGNPERIAACYAPRLERYFSASGVTQKAVLHAVADSRSRNGRLAVLRYSDVLIIPLSPTRAIATFRKHWQTAGPNFLSGELEERLTFARTPGTAPSAWKIVAEQETQVYWTERGR